MEVQGYFLNGMVVPHNGLSLPDGTEVTITVRDEVHNASAPMSEDDRERYRGALSRIDAVANENPGDTFSGADHDRILYGTGSLFVWTAALGLPDSLPTTPTIQASSSGLPRTVNRLLRRTIASMKH